jgi:hypothetical protein
MTEAKGRRLTKKRDVMKLRPFHEYIKNEQYSIFLNNLAMAFRC